MPPVPSVSITKTRGSLGVVPTTNPVGILALIAPLVQGPSMKKGPSTPTLQSKPSQVNSLWDYCLLDDVAEYVITESGKPVLIVPQAPTTAGVLGTPSVHGSGNLASGDITADAIFAPTDDFDLAVRWTFGGTIGTGPIKFQYSIDSRAIDDENKTWSAVQSLGTAEAINFPSTGVVLDLANGKTVVTGDYFTVHVTGPRLTDSDVSAALTALGRASLPWEVLDVEGIDASSTTAANVNTFLAQQEALGKFKAFVIGARLRDQSTNETEAAYLTAMTTAWSGVGTIRGSVTADGGYLTSVPRGVDMIRKTSVPYAARLMAVDYTVDAARVRDGNLDSVRIVDGNGVAQFHDEQLDPGLDDQRLVTLRSFANKAGVFITNPNIISTPGDSYVLMQQARTMNRACEIAFAQLTEELSDSFFTDKTTGKIREDSAQALEAPVKAAIGTEMGKKVSGFDFRLDRDTVFTPPTANLSGDINIQMPIYIKGFTINANLVKTITVATTAGG